MAASGNRRGSPVRQVTDLIGRLPVWIGDLDDSELGEELVEIREAIVQLEAAFADGLRRFDKSGEYKADGAVSLIDWLRWKAKLSGGAAMERVTIARQLGRLPQTRQAFASGDVGYQHVALLARTAEKVGAAAVQGEETNLLKAAESMDPGRFSEVAKTFEYRVDHAAAPPAQLEGVGPIPIETAQRHARDPSVSWLLGQAELESESSHAHQRIPSSTRRALVTRDRGCVVNHCNRPPAWCDGHHVVWWTRGGKTALGNLALVCGRHHRMLHEEGWTLERKDGRWLARPPGGRIPANASGASLHRPLVLRA